MSTLEVKELSAPAGFDIKIASGKTLDLNSQGDVKMPAGSVVQAVRSTDYADLNTSSTTYVTLATITITPRNSSNLILLSVTGGKMNHNTASATTHLYAFYRGAEVLSYNTHWSGGSINYDIALNTTAYDMADTTSPITFHLKGKVSNGNGWLMHDTANQVPNITAMEIAQ